MTTRQPVPAWFTATAIEVWLTGMAAELSAEAKLAGLAAEVSAKVLATGLPCLLYYITATQAPK